MKIALFSSGRANYLPEEIGSLLEALRINGIDYSVNRPFAELIALSTGVMPECVYDALPLHCRAAMMVCYGGDGTFLEGVRLARECDIPILGINSGRLGFLASIPKAEASRALARVVEGRYRIEHRSTLTVEGDLPVGEKKLFAFNELAIHRGAGPMISVEVFVNGEMVGRYWGDGAILSTPSGSTAYSLSAGGPILAPECECFVISPIAPHNLTMRPVVIPDSSVVEFRIGSREAGGVSLTLDNRQYRVEGLARLRASKGEGNVKLVKLNDTSFYDTLRNKMMWGLDRRDQPREE
ncbi:NAD kinase [Bacteroidia bacterium]|nr:NAD kinase [Bacteroidia bacterium]